MTSQRLRRLEGITSKLVPGRALACRYFKEIDNDND